MTDSTSSKPTKKPKFILRVIFPLLIVGIPAYFFISSRDNDPAKRVVLGEIVESGAAAGFNVLLITMDTTRPDRLGCYGYEKAKTPTIDSLAYNGVRFDDAITSVPVTLPSHATIMTGCYPPTTGVRDNGTYRLAERHTTIAEVLKQKGYNTAAFVSAFVLDKRFGLNQGFDVYDFEVSNDGRIGIDSILNERRANDVATAAIRWIRSRKPKKPFFLWTHFFDPHAPYDPPLANIGGISQDPYDAEIGFVDMHLKKIIDTLKKQQILEKTLIVFTTDHGESLGEHEESLHGIFVYNATTQAGIIFSCPALFKYPARVDDRVVGTVDIAPTIFDLLGIKTTQELEGQSLLVNENPKERAIYVESLFPKSHACSPLYSLRRHTDKFILAPTPEYYDLQSDPSETNNLYKNGLKSAVTLEEQLTQLMASWNSQPDEDSQRNISQEEIARLRALGYTGGTISKTTGPLPDPKDQIYVINEMVRVEQLIQKKKYPEALALAQEIYEQSEGWYAPIINQVRIYDAMNQTQKSIELLTEYTNKYPSAVGLYHLARRLYSAENYSECLKKLEAAEILDSDFGGVIPMLRGDVYAQQKQFETAIEYYKKAIKIDPERIEPEILKRIAHARKMLESQQP